MSKENTTFIHLRTQSSYSLSESAMKIDKLVERANNDIINEIILANSATVDGQTTAHYLVDRLTGCEVFISRLAHGLPIGGELDFLDDGTITQALKARSEI